MKLDMTVPARVFLLAASALIAWGPPLLKAEVLEEELSMAQTTVKEWIAVFDVDRAMLLRAQTRREGESLILTAKSTEKLSAQALMGGVVELLDGEILSNALHQPDEPMATSRMNTTFAELENLDKRILATKARIAAVEDQIDAAQVLLRRKAGLEDVARNLERISALRKKIKQLKSIQQLLEKTKTLSPTH